MAGQATGHPGRRCGGREALGSVGGAAGGGAAASGAWSDTAPAHVGPRGTKEYGVLGTVDALQTAGRCLVRRLETRKRVHGDSASMRWVNAARLRPGDRINGHPVCALAVGGIKAPTQYFGQAADVPRKPQRA